MATYEFKVPGDHASTKENNANMEKNKHADSGMKYQGQKEISNFLLILQVTCLCCQQSTGKKNLDYNHREDFQVKIQLALSAIKWLPNYKLPIIKP